MIVGNEVDLQSKEIENIKNSGWQRAIGFKFNKDV